MREASLPLGFDIKGFRWSQGPVKKKILIILGVRGGSTAGEEERYNGKGIFDLTTLSAHFIYGYLLRVWRSGIIERKEMLYLTTHSTHFI